MAEDYEGSEDESGQQQRGGFQLEHLSSYAAFGLRALRARWLWAAALFAVGAAISVLVTIYIPRTYTCKTVLMAVANPILDGTNTNMNPLAGAESLIMRHENLENLVHDTDLVSKASRRPPLLRLKDTIIYGLFGRPDATTQLAILVGTLEQRLDVGTDQSGNLNISVDWSDGKTAAELAKGAREGFIRTRHSAEVSAFEAKMAILDEHANKLRAEVENLAQQINSAHEERAALVSKATGGGNTNPAVPAALRPLLSRAPSPAETGTPIPDLREKLAEMKKRLADLDADREHRMRDEQAKLAELKLHLTPQHPQVVTQQERVAMAAQVSSETQLLRSEVADLESNIRQREANAARSAGSGSIFAAANPGATPAAGAVAPLPQDIVRALENDNTDPALAAQLSGAVLRYGELRDGIRAGRLELDTAQAAFNHRYQIVVPADEPSKPSKPKPALIFGVGIVLASLLALLVPILLQLKKGIMVERWQVYQIQLPVLAELQLPPRSSD